MGNANSGRRSDGTGARNKPKQAVAVFGSGLPDAPDGASPEVMAAWVWLCDSTAGLVFSQDSMVLEQAAHLIVQQRKLQAAIDAMGPIDGGKIYLEFGKQLLAVGRQLLALYSRLGLSPRDRQSLLRPAKEGEVEDEDDEFERLMRDRSEDD